jgi:haloacid dehalogenase superfamily, subfamily IA, variant 1 with third motif having Dx(3-4)D or Dx(3-4)E
MKYKTLFVDFYGTLVHEDDIAIKEITAELSKTAENGTPEEIASFWWSSFKELFENSHGETFQTQRSLESQSLQGTILHFNCKNVDDHIEKYLFSFWTNPWTNPGIFEDTMEFLNKSQLPICIVSNIDRDDIISALNFHKIPFDALVTSEDARSYKPRREIFETALKQMGQNSSDILHIGDSLTSDVLGAKNCGIDTFWLNRKNRMPTTDITPTYSGSSLLDIIPLCE